VPEPLVLLELYVSIFEAWLSDAKVFEEDSKRNHKDMNTTTKAEN
jgi:hypothetical protein